MAAPSSSIGIPCCRFPPSRPLSPSPHSQQQFLLWACSSIPMHQLPDPLHTCEHTSQSGAHRAVVRTVCVFLTLSHLPQISPFTLFRQLQMLPVCPTQSPHQRGGFPEFRKLSSASSPLPQGAGPIPLPLLLLLPSFFSILPSYAGMFIVLSGVQGLLLVFRRCSVRIVASIDVFLMHPWREMNSTSTYSSTILSLLPMLFFLILFFMYSVTECTSFEWLLYVR